MKIKTSEALEAHQAALQLSQRKFPFGAALAVRKLMRELEAIRADVEAERTKLLEQYAQRDEEGEFVIESGQYTFVNGQREAFADAYGELMNAEVKVDARLETRGLEKIEIEPSLLWALGDLLQEE